MALLAGVLAGRGNLDGPASVARFSYLTAICSDRMGNVYVFDLGAYSLRRISALGRVETMAGSGQDRGSVDGTGTAASFGLVRSMAADRDGNVFVATSGETAIRRVTPAGVVSTYAGTPGRSGHLDGSRTEALFSWPQGLTIGDDGSLYVFDFPNIRRITPAGQVSTVQRLERNGSGTYSQEDFETFRASSGAVMDAAGSLHVATTPLHALRSITPAGVSRTLAGLIGVEGHVDGLGSNARFSGPSGVTADRAGNLYVADSTSHTLRKITPAGLVSTLAGTPGARGSEDGAGGIARFDAPHSLAAGLEDEILVVESYATRVRAVSQAGVVRTLAGSRLLAGHVDGMGAVARFGQPAGLALDGSGNVHVLDRASFLEPTGRSRLRKVSPSGGVTTLAMLPEATRRLPEGGPIHPGGPACDAMGNVYVGDRPNYTVIKVSPSGSVSVFAGLSGTSGNADGMGATARFTDPGELALDAAGNLYLADGPLIRKITPAGGVSTLITGALFDAIVGIAVTQDGRSLYLTEARSHAVRRVDLPSGAVSIFAGAVGVAGAEDGQSTAARFNSPGALSVDPAGNVYVADAGNFCIRRMSPDGRVSTVAGAAGKEGFLPGALPGAISSPLGLAVSGDSLYVSMDAGVAVIRNLP